VYIYLSLELGSRTFAHLKALVQLGHHLLYIYGSEVVYYERKGNILSNVRVPPIHVCMYVCRYTDTHRHSKKLKYMPLKQD
jgi:hypothetical protein